VELGQAIDLAQQIAVPAAPTTPAVTFGQLGVPSGTEFARGSFKGSSWAYGFALGVHGSLGEALQIGARYLSRLTFDYSNASATFQQRNTGLILPTALTLPGGPTIPAGTPLDAVLATQFQSGGPLVSQGASTTVKHPPQFQIGLGFTGVPRTTLSVDYEWIGWSAFNTLPLQFNGAASANNRTLIEGYQNSWTVRTGVEYAERSGWAARAGFSYVRTPAPDVTVTPLLPDMNRYNIGLGAGIPLGRTFKLDASYLRVETRGRRGRITERTSEAQTAAQLNSGWYTLHANVFSLSLRAGL
jgi:long-chain fatty acid transport protein